MRLRLQKVWENARGRGGNLTPLGERQHKAIAKRLYQQYPHIFRDSANISARSSVSVPLYHEHVRIHRTTERTKPSLQITREANQRHMDYIAYTSPEAEKLGSASAPWRTAFHTFEENHIHPERLIASLFQNPKEVRNPRELMMGLYWMLPTCKM